MTRELLAEICLGQPDAIEDFPFGDHVSVFKVGGKMFALLPTSSDRLSLTLKCDPDRAESLRRQYPAVRSSNFHKRHWNRVLIDGSIPIDEAQEWIEDSYDLVVDKLPKGLRLRLQGQVRGLSD
ncbi:MAG: MmcQ/YjbR family DNA-binding protein [Actinomycetota bacterium]|jgi:predicted DNA-binding protein (MmcQ/YjbR family)|nr:MmcQ/YjbR family DNA-binding protein [Acidimicrobiales bacterium]MED5541616.1 MmcQ/YjbR family DNA-binding protein [Actinomycetota bacterium]